MLLPGILLALIVIMFIVLVAFLKNILTRNVSSATKHLEKLSSDYMKKQEEIRKRFDEVKHMYQKRLAEAREEAEKIRIDIIKQSNEEKEKIISEARLQSEELIRQGEKARENLILDMEKQIKQKAIEIASELVGQILSENTKKTIHSYMVTEFIERGLNRLDNIEVPENCNEVKIVSAYQLSGEQSKPILEHLKNILGKDVKPSCNTDEGLIAGLLIAIDSLVIDASLKWETHEKVKELIKES